VRAYDISINAVNAVGEPAAKVGEQRAETASDKRVQLYAAAARGSMYACATALLQLLREH
jgi:hypothetical protein